MIGFLPPIYEDELFYSWVARYYERSGYKIFRDALEDFFSCTSNIPSIEFFRKLNEEAIKCIAPIITLDDIIFRHTMFPYYARFLPPKQRITAYNMLKIYQKDFYKPLYVFRYLPKKEFVKYCPLCIVEDKERLGETYIHRKHQIRGIGICYKHGCVLSNSMLMLHGDTNAKRWENIECDRREDIHSLAQGKEKELQIAKYMEQILDAPIDLSGNKLVGDFFMSKVKGSSYVSMLGPWLRENFYVDFLKFYQGCEIMDMPSEAIVDGIFGNKKAMMNGLYIAQIALFLGIDIDELLSFGGLRFKD